MTTTRHQEELLDEALQETFPASDAIRIFNVDKPPTALKAPEARVWKRLLLATDFSDRCEEMLRTGVAVASAVGASIDLVHVHQPLIGTLRSGSGDEDQDAAQAAIDRALSNTAQRIIDAGVTCLTTSLEGSPATQIVAHALKTGANVIVLGSRGHGGMLHSVLGTIANRVSRKATCAVLVIPVPPATDSDSHHEGRLP